MALVWRNRVPAQRADASPGEVVARHRGGVGGAFVVSGAARGEAVRLTALAVCIGGLYALGALLPFWFLSHPNEGVAFFPPAGLTLATLVLTPRRTWPLWLAVAAAAGFTVDVTHHQPAAMAAGSALANTLEPFVGAMGLMWVMRHSAAYFARVLGFIAVPVVGAPLLGALVGATSSTLLLRPNAAGWWSTAGNWWVGDALGVLVVGSAILAWSRPSPFEERAHMAVVVGMAVVAGGVVVGATELCRRPVIYAAMPVAVWAVFAGGSRAVTTVGAVAAGAADWAALTGRSQLLGLPSTPRQQLLILQTVIGVTLLTGMVLAAQIAERRRSDDLARRAELQRVSSEEAAVKLAEAERHSMARDTHDIVGHGLNAILLHAGAARRVLDRDTQLARELLCSIEELGRRACSDLDLALSVAGVAPIRKPGQGLGGLPDLLTMLEAAGLKVTLKTEGEPRAVPTLVDWSAYRIVQEAFTNVLKHAPGASATVTVRFAAADLYLSVVDHGGQTTAAPSRHEGRGIIGIRERATALGGSLRANHTASGGFRVVARLPFAPA